ncbi:MAG: amino acid ABC transporter substrate-binding protein [Thermodesulfobacteriota bacterium]
MREEKRKMRMGDHGLKRKGWMKRLCFRGVAIFIAILFSEGIIFAQQKFRIGYAVPLTGTFGRDGNLVKDAYAFWADMVNRKGGIEVKGKRYPIELIFMDDKSIAAENAKLTEKLITEDKVDLILGGFGSDSVFAGSAVAEKYKHPMISGAASSNKLFERGFKYYFSTLGKATEEVRGCVDIVQVLSPKPKNGAIVGSDILFTALACEGYKKYAVQNKVEIVHFELFPITLQDYNSMLLKVKQKKPDVLFVGSHLMVAMKMIKAMKEIDFTPKMVTFSYGPTVPDFVKNLGKDAEYVIAASEWAPNLPYKDPLFGTAKQFNENYFRKYGRYPDYVEAASAAGVYAMQVAIERLGITPPVKEVDRVKLMEELYKQDLKTFYGVVKFGPDGANEAHPPVAVQIQNGKLVNVFPKEAAETAAWYPMKPWKER